MKTRLKKKVDRYLKTLVETGVAPGFQLALGVKQETLGVYQYGIRDFKTERPITDLTWFDLASLTKVVSTCTLFMFAVQNRFLKSIDEKVGECFPFLNSDLRDVSIRELLNHRSGLPPVFESVDDKIDKRSDRVKYFLTKIDEAYPQHSVNRSKEIYSDVGFMLLGLVLEHLYAKRLRDIFADHFQENFEISYGKISQPWERLSRFLPFPNTARTQCYEDKEVSYLGEAQDPRARWLGGDAGHSGLFGTALGVEIWAKELFSAYHGKSLFLSDKVARNFLDFDSALRFRNGFDTPTNSDAQVSQAGSTAGPNTIGHLGFTGCSFWMDLDTGIRVTLLSHRHAPSVDAAKLSKERPRFHDWLYREIFDTFL